jgi:putative tricarboxylic transport membrane protein
MLAALTLHGINPGPQVMRMYSAEVYALFLAVFLANALLWPFGFFYNKMISKLSLTNTGYLIPAIFCICLVGSYATRGFGVDMYLFLIFGVLGYILIENGYPLVPLILGLVMGQIAEENFIVSFRLSKGSYGIFFQTTITWILWVAIVVALVAPQILDYWREKKRREGKLNDDDRKLFSSDER